MTSDKQFTRKEVGLRNIQTDLIVIIENRVYDLTKFQDDHPGGHEVLIKVAGTDATEEFHDVGHGIDAKELMTKYCVGEVVPAEHVEVRPRQVWSTVAAPIPKTGSGSSWRVPIALGVLATLLYYLLF